MAPEYRWGAVRAQSAFTERPSVASAWKTMLLCRRGWVSLYSRNKDIVLATAATAAWLQPLGWEQQEPMDAAAAGTAPGDAARPRKKKKLKRGGLNASERRARDDVEGGGD